MSSLTRSDSGERIVREFFDAWDGPDPRAAFDEHLAEDCVWLNTGLPTLEGKQACMQLVDIFLGHFPKIRIDIGEIASSGEVVFVQRTDNCLDPDGEVAAVTVRRADGSVTWTQR